MSTWYTITLAVAALIAIALFYNEARLRAKDAEYVESLQRQLKAHKYIIESLRSDKATLEIELRTSQQVYIVDLPNHIPSARIYEN